MSAAVRLDARALLDIVAEQLDKQLLERARLQVAVRGGEAVEYGDVIDALRGVERLAAKAAVDAIFITQGPEDVGASVLAADDRVVRPGTDRNGLDTDRETMSEPAWSVSGPITEALHYNNTLYLHGRPVGLINGALAHGIAQGLNRYDAIKELTEERFDLSRLLKDIIPIELPAPGAH